VLDFAVLTRRLAALDPPLAQDCDAANRLTAATGSGRSTGSRPVAFLKRSTSDIRSSVITRPGLSSAASQRALRRSTACMRRTQFPIEDSRFCSITRGQSIRSNSLRPARFSAANEWMPSASITSPGTLGITETMRSKRPASKYTGESVSGRDDEPSMSESVTPIVVSISSSRKSLSCAVGRSRRGPPSDGSCAKSSSSKNTVTFLISFSTSCQACRSSATFPPECRICSTRRGQRMARNGVSARVASAAASIVLPELDGPISSSPEGENVPQRAYTSGSVSAQA
jgi:hypothetical protein